MHQSLCRLAVDCVGWIRLVSRGECHFGEMLFKKIDDTFLNSRFTLVYDQDVQEIDNSSANFHDAPADPLTVRCAENILAALLVSDWNVHAWPFPESVKGWNNILMFCKKNQKKNSASLACNKDRFGILLPPKSEPTNNQYNDKSDNVDFHGH